ncbi:MAG: FecR family protein [Candidatus Omnitrophica bacterium]|nr:FecR family protein [Candidatus Omnitrophota bacterium]
MRNAGRKLKFKLLASFISTLLILSYAYAQEVGKVTYVDGRVDIFRQGSNSGTPVREYEPISTGDSIRTKAGAKAEIRFEDNSVIRIAQNSKIEIKDYQLDEKNKRKTAAIGLDRGKVRTIIAKMPNAADFAIITPNATGNVKGSDIIAFYQAGNSVMLVAEGKLSVAGTAYPENKMLILAGNSVLVPFDGMPQGPRPYLETERKLYEQDTDIPVVLKAEKLTIIIGSVSKISGSVKITAKGESSAHEARIGETVQEGYQIETDSNGLAEIRLDNNAINMKPNTKLMIIRLAINPETGEYENIFELTIGKIKARIENLKGKSKFEVKTPLAVCGARGTILYVDVSPSGTTLFVEGGMGYITNTINGISQNLDIGQNMSIAATGTVSAPAYTTPQDRQSFGEGWDPGNGVEGYSAPEGTIGMYLYESDAGTATVGGADTGGGIETPDAGGAAGGTTENVVNIPITETTQTSVSTTDVKIIIRRK